MPVAYPAKMESLSSGKETGLPARSMSNKLGFSTSLFFVFGSFRLPKPVFPSLEGRTLMLSIDLCLRIVLNRNSFSVTRSLTTHFPKYPEFL